MKTKILNILLLIFSILFLIFPTSYGIVDLKIVIAYLALFATFIYLKNKFKWELKIQEKYYIWIIFALAIITRIGVVIIFNSYISQVSDFQKAIEASKTLNFEGPYYMVFTHWILYPTLLHYIYMIFGNAQIVALLTNAIILIGAAILIYMVGTLLFDNKKYGFIASLLYILWPANIFYTLIFSQEHLCAFILILVLYLFLRMEKEKNNGQLHYINMILIGSLLGLSAFFKNFAPVFIIAFIIYYLLDSLKITVTKKYLIEKASTILLICLSFVISKNIIFLGVDHLVGAKVARNIVPCYLNVGLRGDGKYSKENYRMYFDTLEANQYDYDKTNKEITGNLIEYLKSSDSSIKQEGFFDNKARVLFAGDKARVGWIIQSLKAEEHYTIAKIMEKVIKEINNHFFIMLVVFMALGMFILNREKNTKIFLLYLIFYGSFLLLILVEAQNRYMYAVQPIMCILAPLGLQWFRNQIENNVIKEDKKYEINSL